MFRSLFFFATYLMFTSMNFSFRCIHFQLKFSISVTMPSYLAGGQALVTWGGLWAVNVDPITSSVL